MHRGVRDSSKKKMFLQQCKTHLSKTKKLSLHREGCKSFIAMLLAEDAAPDTSTRKLPGGQEQPFGALPGRAGKFPEPWCQSKAGSLCLSAVPMHPPVPWQCTQDCGQFVGIWWPPNTTSNVKAKTEEGGSKQQACRIPARSLHTLMALE